MELSERRSSKATLRNRFPISLDTFTESFTAFPVDTEAPDADADFAFALTTK